PEPHAGPTLVAGREAPVATLVVVQGEADLLQVVHALGPPGRFPGRLHRREQQGDEDGDDGDDDQQLNEGEAVEADTLLTSGRANHTGTLRGGAILLVQARERRPRQLSGRVTANSMGFFGNPKFSWHSRLTQSFRSR